MIRQNITGLYQLCPNDKISKYDLLKLFAKIWNKEMAITPFDGYAVDKSLVCTRSDYEYPRPEYEKMLVELKAWMDKHPEYYHHYEG
jgi:hypothetical protein